MAKKKPLPDSLRPDVFHAEDAPHDKWYRQIFRIVDVPQLVNENIYGVLKGDPSLEHAIPSNDMVELVCSLFRISATDIVKRGYVWRVTVVCKNFDDSLFSTASGGLDIRPEFLTLARDKVMANPEVPPIIDEIKKKTNLVVGGSLLLIGGLMAAGIGVGIWGRHLEQAACQELKRGMDTTMLRLTNCLAASWYGGILNSLSVASILRCAPHVRRKYTHAHYIALVKKTVEPVVRAWWKLAKEEGGLWAATTVQISNKVGSETQSKGLSLDQADNRQAVGAFIDHFASKNVVADQNENPRRHQSIIFEVQSSHPYLEDVVLRLAAESPPLPPKPQPEKKKRFSFGNRGGSALT